MNVLWEGDVVVAGGGSAGCAAAVAAVRSGASCLLVESAGFLGGTGAAVLDTFYGFYSPGPEAPRVVGGVGWEVCERLFAAGAAFERPNTYGAGTGVTYEPEQLKVVWDELTADAEVLLHARVCDVVPGEGVVVETVAGRFLVRARVVVDATGDAEVAWRAGAALDRPGLRRQPMTTTFRLGGVDPSATSTAELHALMAGADLPRREGSIHRTVNEGVVHTNLTRVSGLDPTDPFELSRAEREGRRQVGAYVRFLREKVPGYGSAVLLGTSTRIGVRESRRLAGRYVLTRDDVLAGRDFPDAIARCGAPVEDHDSGSGTRWEYVRDFRTYGIPYRCLLPVEVGGLIVAGRCLSATHDAHASARSMGQCMAMGQAAGTAAALAVQAGVEPAELDAGLLRERLREEGALL
ncbi:FAD-dependent oxidoreductase [Nonomuraea rhodomycinica]|uniref:FAD-dependent oxidoreductase n=1 Tax=Nonomuraea rhodomycinica TaxID=1712872 RepID=A0A7Y6IPR0_9ACTN|nr:FAD-dependent oxidoreductase [Nonomuraea rhodomycinica]NUW42157.1 FAD-dependent oxidoreductase [Nonomuraea rhodomycinica]